MLCGPSPVVTGGVKRYSDWVRSMAMAEAGATKRPTSITGPETVETSSGSRKTLRTS